MLRKDMFPRRPDPVETLTGRSAGTALPKAISPEGGGGKFDLDGKVRHWPGNTVLCHLDRTSPAHALLAELQDKVRRSAFGGLFTYLPADSFHMTVFQGWSPFLPDENAWPEGVPRDATRDGTTDVLRRKFDGLTLPQRFRIRPDGLFGLHSLTVCGADDEEERRLRDARIAMRDASGLVPRDFDSYVFHVSLAYQLRWVDDAMAREMVAFSDELGSAFAAEVPEIEIGPCELCDFENMHHFEPVLYLGNNHVEGDQAQSGREGHT
ncbi:DUF1868 domain-containing protein [Oceanibium sediminis]|uniref:DUF1868 domain-containing protein n=1 Tax=Oceanibium sediminis TaxID=2026339 RepID=UPI001E5AD5D3|nr:DUF1868 domain-containing protein [Oceanibium sediminis]